MTWSRSASTYPRICIFLGGRPPSIRRLARNSRRTVSDMGPAGWPSPIRSSDLRNVSPGAWRHVASLFESARICWFREHTATIETVLFNTLDSTDYERLVLSELDAAARSSTLEEQKAHLDQAAAFAATGEQTRGYALADAGMSKPSGKETSAASLRI